MSEPTKCPKCKKVYWEFGGPLPDGEFCQCHNPPAQSLCTSCESLKIQLDAMTAERDEAKLVANLYEGQLALATLERDELLAESTAMQAKLDALAPHGTCGCSLDKPGDLCLHHSPQLVAMTAERDAAVSVSENFKDQLIEMRAAKKAADSLTGPPQAWLVTVPEGQARDFDAMVFGTVEDAESYIDGFSLEVGEEVPQAIPLYSHQDVAVRVAKAEAELAASRNTDFAEKYRRAQKALKSIMDFVAEPFDDERHLVSLLQDCFQTARAAISAEIAKEKP